MSESLRECEVESVDANGDRVAKGEWKCGKCPGVVTWESRVPPGAVDRCESPEQVKKLIESEHRLLRKNAAREVERHLAGHTR